MKYIVLIACLYSSLAFTQTFIFEDEITTKDFGKRFFHYKKNKKELLEGYYKIGYDDGSYILINFVKGEYDGKFIAYHENGNLKATSFFKDGLKHGKETFYNDKEIKIQENNFKNGKTHGDQLDYTEQGKLISVQTYKNGKRHGKWLRHFISTYKGLKGTRVEYYKDDNPVGHWIEKFENGQIYEEKIYTAPKDYTHKKYYENQTLAIESVYVNNKIDSKKKYNITGELVIEEMYRNGQLVKEIKHNSKK
ncbi:toxin-antitoxin system YwqK family antitoxin [Aquimarina algicola]|uniref:Toxin-antitoxin system YwqK family antitoxin n=1 Tax=Aquimarina algicola TaxID=2589995 RepID=A0A504J2H3_9FLAO|nr:hypothetical protein [Aquimarina algicola]TPN82815.1 hypothetical protein FHK87_20525 [Aquimarina algicola]